MNASRHVGISISCVRRQLHDAKLFEFVIHPIVQRSASLYCFYMGWKQITFALLTVTAAGAALTFAIDLGRYAFASWH